MTFYKCSNCGSNNLIALATIEISCYVNGAGEFVGNKNTKFNPIPIEIGKPLMCNKCSCIQITEIKDDSSNT